jgi:predicted MFS family arabinose efflux permease
LRTLIVLALTQLIGWGSVGLIAIVGRQMADDLGMDLTAVFAGNSILYLVMGLCAPLLAKSFAGFGARLVMIGGTAVAGLGFAVLALSEGPVMYVLAWVILGIAGSATLTTPAFILLNEVVRPNARSAISALMLVTGLSSSLFWPIASFLSQAVGWRITCLIYAGSMALLSLPLLTTYARTTSHIALPLNVMSALSPPGLAAGLTHFGSNAVLGLAILCSCSALVILFILSRRRPKHQPA